VSPHAFPRRNGRHTRVKATDLILSISQDQRLCAKRVDYAAISLRQDGRVGVGRQFWEDTILWPGAQIASKSPTGLYYPFPKQASGRPSQHRHLIVGWNRPSSRGERVFSSRVWLSYQIKITPSKREDRTGNFIKKKNSCCPDHTCDSGQIQSGAAKRSSITRSDCQISRQHGFEMLEDLFPRSGRGPLLDRRPGGERSLSYRRRELAGAPRFLRIGPQIRLRRSIYCRESVCSNEENIVPDEFNAGAFYVWEQS